MTLFKKSFAGGKKQTSMPGPNSAAYKKIVAAKKALKAAGVTKQVPQRSSKKKAQSGGPFSSVKSKQMLVQRIKRAIWASFQEINESIITLAKSGNTAAAKTLFDFAGVYSLPSGDDENVTANVAASPAAAESAESVPCDPVSGLLRSIGLDLNGEPELAVQGL
jgi:hypothetical protein